MKLLSICIPSYNRPNEIIRLLESIDKSCSDEIEVVVCEDNSPLRLQIRRAIEGFKKISNIEINYFENELNLGYDANLKQLIKKSNGQYIMYMGDDDTFETANLSNYINFLKDNLQLGYILRRYSVIHKNGRKENFRYFNHHRFFEKGIVPYKELLRKSVFVSGFCFKRELVLPFFDCTNFNGTLLYQLFICAEITLNYPSAYCDIPITVMNINQRGIPEFGSSTNEKSQYTPGVISVENSVNFMKSFLVITRYIDAKYKFNSTQLFLIDLSKYSYPVLSIQRASGLKQFITYNKILRREIHINCTFYYYIYYLALLLLGSNICDLIIVSIKKTIGRTPHL